MPKKPTPAAERFAVKVDRSAGPDGCWPWTAGVFQATGYGVFHPVKGVTTTAHKFAFEQAHGPRPDGAHIDHICHNDTDCPGGRACLHRLCCNPSHLEATEPSLNVARSHRSNGRKTHCPEGHAYTPQNTRIQVRPNTESRSCKTCARERDAQRPARPRRATASRI